MSVILSVFPAVLANKRVHKFTNDIDMTLAVVPLPV